MASVAPERQRARVAHEHLGRVGVEPQKRQQRAGDREAERHQIDLAVLGGDDAVRRVGHRRRVAGQRVEPVGQIDRVRRAHDRQQRQRDHPPADDEWAP